MKKILLVMILALLTEISYGQIIHDFTVGPVGAKRFAVLASGSSATHASYSGITFVTKDSTVVSDITYSHKTPFGQTIEIYPDSMYLLWYGKGYTTADSIGLIGVVVPIYDANAGAAYLTRTIADSIKAQENDYKLLTRSWYEPFKKLKIVWSLNTIVSGGADKTEHISLGGAYFYATLRAFYTVPN